MIDTPIAVMSGARRGAPRSGRYASRSMAYPTSMQTGTAQPVPMSTTLSAGRPEGASALITVKATMAPIITTSPCAKLMSWMMP
jgi:hypothetical protein